MELCMWSMSWSRLVQLHPIYCIDWSAIIDFNWHTPHLFYYSVDFVMWPSCCVLCCSTTSDDVSTRCRLRCSGDTQQSNQRVPLLHAVRSARHEGKYNTRALFRWDWHVHMDRTVDGRDAIGPDKWRTFKKLNNRWLMIKREIKRTETMVLRLLNLLHP